MSKQLPDRPSLSSLRYQAKQIVKRHYAADPVVCESLRSLHKLQSCSDSEILKTELVLADAQHAIALEYGFADWLALRNHTLAADPTQMAEGGLNLTQAQLDEFHYRGIINVPGFLPDDIIDPARELVHGVLEKAEVLHEGKWTAERLTGKLDYAIQSKLLKALNYSTKRSPEFASICTAELQDAAEQLMDGRTLVTTVTRPQILFTAPNATHWELPHKVWHMDIARVGEIGCPGVQLFTFIDQVDPESAGTVVAAGSHHYINDRGKVKSKEVKRQLRQSNPWFKGLLKPDGGDRRRYLKEPTCDGDVELQVVELTGAPGDVWLMDLRVLHSLAPNTADRPRLMASQRYYLPEGLKAAYEGAADEDKDYDF